MTANIFISFASKDVKMAMTLCTALENRGYKCWISARDIQPGENFQIAIVQAIRHAKIMLLVFTGNSNNSEEMTKELALASQQKMIVIPLRVEDVTPSDAFAYEFATRQWIDFFADWEFAIEQLARRIANALRDRSAGVETPGVTEALNEVAAMAPVAYTIGPPKAEAPTPAKAEAPAPAKAPEPPKAAPAPEKPAAKAPANPEPAVPEPILEVRKELLAQVTPSEKAAPVVAPSKASEPAKPAARPRPEPRVLEPAEPGEKRGMNAKTLALVAGVIVVVLTGIGLIVPRLISRPEPAPVQVAAPPPAPTVVQVSTPVAEPAVPVADPALALNTPSATNDVKPAVAAPRKKAAAPKVQAPKDDIPF
ncbi:MAG: hypothetical protein JWO33_397 [Caulobacteraceae bacterium]|nr:hypothetical protein [Caulobacteraceae bacterium]